MEASLTNLKSRRTQGHRRRGSVRRRSIEGLRLQRDIDPKAIGRKRIMM